MSTCILTSECIVYEYIYLKIWIVVFVRQEESQTLCFSRDHLHSVKEEARSIARAFLEIGPRRLADGARMHWSGRGGQTAARATAARQGDPVHGSSAHRRTFSSGTRRRLATTPMTSHTCRTWRPSWPPPFRWKWELDQSVGRLQATAKTHPVRLGALRDGPSRLVLRTWGQSSLSVEFLLHPVR